MGEDNEATVGCWTDADFEELSIRFKVYQFYHTAMKATSIVTVPSETSTINMALTTLPYQYSDVTVTVLLTFRYVKLNQTFEENAVIAPMSDGAFDSDDIVGEIMTVDEVSDGMDGSIKRVVDNDDDGQKNGSSDWMFIAALCSSVIGAFVLMYICISAYKGYLRKEYDSIKDKSQMCSRRISLRSVSIDKNDEERSIMHSSASYSSYSF